MTTTVRLLSTYDGNPPQTIVRLPDALAASFVAMGNASLDLTGGINKPAAAIPHTISSAARLIYNDTGTFLGLGDAQGNLLVTPAGLTIPNAFGKPGAPTGFTLTAAAGAVVAAFTAPADLGGDPSTVRYVLSLSNGTKVEGGSSPISAAAPAGTAVSGTVTAISSLGESAPSASATATPTGPAVANALTLTGPTSGTIGSASGAYTVALSPGGASVAAPVTVTPTAVAGVTFAPASLTLTTAAPSGTFTATATTSGTKAIAVTNNGGLTNPAAISLVIAAASTPATALTLTGPTTATTGSASSAYTVALAPTGGTVTGTVTVTPTPVAGVTFAPTSLSLTTASPSATFTALLAADGAKTIAITNDGGLTNPSAITLTASSAATTPGAPTISSVADSGATSHTVTLTAPGSNGGSAITDYVLASATVAGVADPKVWDMSAGSTSTTRVLMGATPGKSYVYTFAAKNANGTGPASAASTARAMPSWSVAAPSSALLMFGDYGLPYAPSATATTADTSYQIGWGALPFDFDGIQILAFNFSRTLPCTYKWSASSPPVLGTYPLQGSTVGTGGLTALNNGGTWADGIALVVPVSDAATDADALFSPGLALSEVVAVTRNARTDGGVGSNAAVRLCVPTGSVNNQTTWMPSVVSGSNWYPGQEVVGGQLNGMTLRAWKMDAIDAVANKAGFTAGATYARATQAPAVFIVFRLKGVVVGYQSVNLGDSRDVFGTPALNNPVGTHLLAWAAACTAAKPFGYLNLGLSGKSPAVWLQLWNKIGAYVPVGTGSVPNNSINGWGGTASGTVAISSTGFNANATDANTLAANMKTQGHRVYRSSIIGVDTINTNTYHWNNDIAQRHDTNRAAETASTAALPILPLGTLSEGPIESTNNSYTVATRDGATNWLEQLDATRAHPTNAWALAMYQYELALLTAGT